MSEALHDRRHTRQARLAEVGEAAQARLRAGEARITAAGPAGVVGARYAAGAGFGALRVPSAEAAHAAREVDARVRVAIDPGVTPQSGPTWLAELDPAAREVALGAHEALRAIRDRLEAAP
jgi:hypothetical protein